MPGPLAESRCAAKAGTSAYGEGEGDALGEAEALALGDADGLTVGDADALADGDAVGEALLVTEALGDGVGSAGSRPVQAASGTIRSAVAAMRRIARE